MLVSPPDLENDFPDFYRSADKGSLDGQRRYVTATRVQLIALSIAAVGGALTLKLTDNSVDWAGVIAVVAFATALLVRAFTWRARPERDWYSGRAAAESAKTLGWRFAVGADPFPVGLSIDEATDLMLERLKEIGRGLGNVVIVPPVHAKGEVTPRMIEVRLQDIDSRKAIYLDQRIEAQRSWYARKAKVNLKLSRTWMTVMLVLEALGVAAGVLKAVGVLQVDLLGILGALVAGIVAWTEMRQNANLASAYSVAARELSSVFTRGSRSMTEDEWALFAANAEEAISREHTMWAASRDA